MSPGWPGLAQSIHVWSLILPSSLECKVALRHSIPQYFQSRQMPFLPAEIVSLQCYLMTAHKPSTHRPKNAKVQQADLPDNHRPLE